MNWCVAEYRRVKDFDRLEWLSDTMTQSEAIRRAQSMNDSAATEEKWWVATRVSQVRTAEN